MVVVVAGVEVEKIAGAAFVHIISTNELKRCVPELSYHLALERTMKVSPALVSRQLSEVAER